MLYAEIVVTFLFMIILTMHDTLLSLPFSLFKTFVVEQNHGFNKSTLGLFFHDKVLNPVTCIIIILLCLSASIVILIVTITADTGSQLSSYGSSGLPCDWNDCRNSSMGRTVLLRCSVGIPICDQHIDAHNIPHLHSPHIQQVHKAGRRYLKLHCQVVCNTGHVNNLR
jgi:CAAX prenyl protease N-terminal, five membrane helices